MAERAAVTMKPLTQPFVSADYRRSRAGLVVAPNPNVALLAPQHAEPHAIADRALDQHAVFARRLSELGLAVDHLAASDRGLCFAASDLAVIVENGAVLMRPSDLDRRAEVSTMEAKLTELGIPILGRLEGPSLLDGGDVLLSEGTAYVAVPHGDGPYSRRSNVFGREAFAEISGLRVVEVPVSAVFPRLNSVATLIDASTVVLGAAALDHAPFEGLTKIVVPVGEELAAGMLPLGERQVVTNLRFRETPALLRQARVKVESLDLWEFGKLGFSPASLFLAISRQ